MKIKLEPNKYVNSVLCAECENLFKRKCPREKYIMTRDEKYLEGMQFFYKDFLDEFIVYCPQYKRCIFVVDLIK